MKNLILLVGSNPLPNYLAAKALRAGRVLLVYSPETAEPKNRLRDVLRDAGIQTDERVVQSATDAREIRGSLMKLPTDSHLHYTGGTKTMAAHARMVFQQQGGEDSAASYFDEGDGVVRFDDGTIVKLQDCDLGLTLDLVLRLHGSTHHLLSSTATLEEAKDVARNALQDPSLCERLYGAHRGHDNKRLSVTVARDQGVSLRELGLNLSIDRFPGVGWTRDMYNDWDKFLGGGWMELWIADIVRSIVGNHVSSNVECYRMRRTFEIDVIVVRGHRVHVISCTTHRTLPLCKSKLFEVALRARHVGGELARSAVACFLHGGDKDAAYVDHLRNDVESVWDAPRPITQAAPAARRLVTNTPQVFGLDDLRQWFGQPEDGVAPNAASLRAWLES